MRAEMLNQKEGMAAQQEEKWETQTWEVWVMSELMKRKPLGDLGGGSGTKYMNGVGERGGG